MIRIGVDTGGTFTDLVLLDGRELFVHKVRSTPDDPSRAILGGIREILALRTAPGDAGEAPVSGLDVVHGSTVATNAVLERRGRARRRWSRRGLRGRAAHRPPDAQGALQLPGRRIGAPLVEAGLTFGVDERCWPTDRCVDAARSRGRWTALVASLRGGGAVSVAVCLLHSYANPAHERVIADRLRDEGFSVSASHVVLPEYREFERWSTTVVNAYVTPLMDRYLGRLRGRPRSGTRLSIMQSNGGSISATQRAGGSRADDPVGAGGRRRRRARRRRGGGIPARHQLRHGRHVDRREPHRRRASASRPSRRSATSRCACRSSTSTRSAPAAGRSPTSTPAARCASARAARAPIPGPSATARGPS